MKYNNCVYITDCRMENVRAHSYRNELDVSRVNDSMKLFIGKFRS